VKRGRDGGKTAVKEVFIISEKEKKITAYFNLFLRKGATYTYISYVMI